MKPPFGEAQPLTGCAYIVGSMTFTKAIRVCFGGLLLGALLLPGCSSASRHSTSARSPASARAIAANTDTNQVDAAVPPSEKEANRRIKAQAHYGTAVLYEQQGEAELALKHFEQAAYFDITNESLVLVVAQQLYQNKQPDRALALLHRATGVPNASAAMYAGLGLTYAQLGKTNEAINSNRVALKKRPRFLPAYQNLIQIYLQMHQAKEVAKIFDEALRQPSPEAVFLIDIADVFIRCRALLGSEAEELRPRMLEGLNHVNQQKPDTFFLKQKLGDAYYNLGESAKAAEIYRQLLAKYPNLPKLREKLASIYYGSGDTQHATELYEAILRDNPANPDVCYLLGKLAAQANDIKKAADYYEKTLLLTDNPGPVFDLARAQIQLHQGDKALATLDKIRGKIKNNFGMELETALAYIELKKPNEARKHITAAEVIAAVNETNAVAHLWHFELGAACERNKDYEQAEKHFQKSLTLEPDDAEALNYLGYMWADRGVKLEDAKILIEKAVKIAPNNAAFIDSLGWVLFKLNQPKEALTHILKAVELNSKPDPTLYDHLGDIYATLKQADKAREAWRKSLEVEPNDDIKKKLDAVSK